MKKIIKYNLIALLAMVFFMSSCDDEDNTNYSDLVKTSPIITVSGIQAGGYDLIESDTTYKFDVTLSEAQISDISIYVTQTEGSATIGEDFAIVNGNNRVYIPANSKTGVLEIKVLTDEIKEGEETFTLQIGDERTTNGTIDPINVEFTIQNYTEGDLLIDMGWDVVVYDQEGELLDPLDVADMILWVYDDAGNIVLEADGASFESTVLASDATDGTYYIQAGFWSVMSDLDIDADIDITLDLFQTGEIDATYNYIGGPVSTGTYDLCEYNVILVKVVKSGANYTLTESGAIEFNLDTDDFLGTYGGADGSLGDGANWRFDNPVTVALDGADLTIDGINVVWMENIWGEAVTSTTPVIMTMNIDGTINIEDQYYMTTDYDGDAYDYNISGSGTYSLCDNSLHIEYDIGGLGAWLFNNGYSFTDYLIADIELGAKGEVVNITTNVNFDKPVK